MVVWMSTKFPVEIPAVFGAEIFCPESFAAAVSAKGLAPAYLGIAADAGLSEDLCAYMRIGLAAAELLSNKKEAGSPASSVPQDSKAAYAADSRLPLPPRPDALLCCTNICSGMMNWYRGMARRLSIPLFLLDIPLRGTAETASFKAAAPAGTVDADLHGADAAAHTVNAVPGEVPPSLTAYLRGQAEEIIRGLERISGTAWSNTRFFEVTDAVRESTDAWEALLRLSEEDPCPFESFELFDFMPVMVTERWKKETAEKLRGIERQVRSRMRSGMPGSAEAHPAETSAETSAKTSAAMSAETSSEKQYRVFFEGTPCWPHVPAMKAALDRAGMRITADTITPSLSFRYEDFDGMLAAYCRTINGSPFAEGAAMRLGLVRRSEADAAVIHYNRSCRPWCGTLPETVRTLQERAGIPAFSFEGDQADPSAFHEAQFANGVAGLREMLESKAQSPQEA